MKYKIVSDSSSNVPALDSVPYTAVPLHIMIDQQIYVDNGKVDLEEMNSALSVCATSSTACPAPGDWLDAFEDAETIFCITITSKLSGSYSSAQLAKADYEELHPERHVYVIDSLSTGPEMALVIEKLQELILKGMDGPEILDEIQSYSQKTHLLFCLESLENLAKNGRVSRAAAKLAGILGIRIIGQASDQGELQLLSKCRGEQCTISRAVKYMKEHGYTHGPVRIVHNQNPEAAKQLALRIQNTFGTADIQITSTGALCGYYAEKAGFIIGYEC